MKKRTKRILFTGLILLSFPGSAQNTYLKTIGTDVSDYGTSCIPMANGGSVLTTTGGISTGPGVEFGLVRTDVNGAILWQKTFTHNTFALARNVVSTSDGGLCVFGQIDKIGSSNKALFLMKTDSSGNELWSKRIEASANDRPARLIACQSGGFLSCSISDYNVGSYPAALLVRFDENGTVLWTKKYSVLQGVSPETVVDLPNGDFAFVSSISAQFSGPFLHTLITRVNAQGQLLWSSMFYGQYDDQPYDLIATPTGELYISGATYRTGNEWDGYLLKVNSSGTLTQSTCYNAGTASGEHFRRLAQTSDGNIVLLGDQGSSDARNITLLKTKPTGEPIWARHYPISPNFTNYGFDLYETQDLGFVFTGDIRPPAYVRDAALVKTDAAGQVSCYTADAAFATDNPGFQSLDIFMIEQEVQLSVYEPFAFSDPGHPITEKTVCANLYPIMQFSTESTADCPQVCVDFTDATLNEPTSWFWVRDAALVKTDAVGQISCYTADADFATDDPGFQGLDIFMTEQAVQLSVYEPFAFSDPGHPITEKTVCANLYPIVQFSTESTADCPQVCVDFTDATLNEPTSWFWEFEGATPLSSTEQHPQNICYPKPGTYTVRVTVKNAYGTAIKEQTFTLDNFDCPAPEIPNVFTPNGDGVNDLWEFPVYSSESVLYIYNRWGTLVHQAKGTGLSWDGKTQQGLAASEGVYFYKLETQGEVKHGFLHLER